MRLLFTAGTARGGTNIRTLMLNNHSQIGMSLDPFIPLFRYYRDSLLKSVDSYDLLSQVPSRNVLDDYYFSIDKIKIMKAIQTADPDIAFDGTSWEELKISIAKRMELGSVNLIPYLDILPAKTFRDVFNNITKLISAACGNDKDLVWAGFNDNWTMEFIPIVAKIVPDAKFIIHLRDPRAVINSSEFAEPDPAKRPTVISFARHLRKYYAFTTILNNNPDLGGRLLITYYEPFIMDTEKVVRRMTDFLGVDYQSDMINVDLFRKANGERWPSDWDIYKSSPDIWRTKMPHEMIELTEFICDPEMRLHNYHPEIYNNKAGLSESCFEYALQNFHDCLGWRTDYPEVERMLGSEYFRKKLLQSDVTYSEEVIDRCFLSSDVFNSLKLLD